MRVLELFSGSGILSATARAERGAFTLTVDKFQSADLNIGIEDLTREMILCRLGVPDMVWASPVCSAWSKTGWFHYWDTSTYAKTKKFVSDHPYASESVEMVRKSIEIFSWFPSAVFFMENPEGMLYRHPVINNFIRYNLPVKRHTITYCQYGDTIRKPTHIWTNSTSWLPRSTCKPGGNCHQSSPRGTTNGMYSKGDAFERSVIPVSLCRDVLHSIKEEAVI